MCEIITLIEKKWADIKTKEKINIEYSLDLRNIRWFMIYDQRSLLKIR